MKRLSRKLRGHESKLFKAYVLPVPERGGFIGMKQITGWIAAFTGPVANAGRWWAVVIGVLFFASAAGVLVDLKNTAKYGQVDLRNRVVGARVMLLGKNPYAYRWQPGEPTTLLDSEISPQGSVSRVTVTPAVLAVHSVMAGLNYRWNKFGWLVIQLGLFASIVWMAIKQADDSVAKGMIMIVGLVFSCCTCWRFHVERGQAYVLFAFFAALFIARQAKANSPRTELVAGVVLGVLTCLRPQYAVLGLPLLIYWRPVAIGGAVAGVLLGVLVPTLISRPVWSQYAALMADYAHVKALPEDAAQVPPPIVEFPPVIEGMTNLTSRILFPDIDSSLKEMLGVFGLKLPTLVSLGIILSGVVLWSVVIFWQKRRGAPIAFATAKTLGLVLLAEIALPIKRMSYGDVILMLSIIWLIACNGRLLYERKTEAILATVALLFAFGLTWMPLGGIVPVFAVLILALMARWQPKSV